VSPPACARHPGAVEIAGCCGACLFESALSAGLEQTEAVTNFVVQVPLGERVGGSVFLVRVESPTPRLLRLKRCHSEAHANFVERFNDLKARLEKWGEPTVVMPVTAWLDSRGWPSLLTDFRQGLPLLDCVRSGRLSAALAAAGLRHLRDVVTAAHARGLAHGSIVNGNVFVGRSNATPCLLDFGIHPLLTGLTAADWMTSDLDGFAQLEADLRSLTASV
jgi:hypothetical protein